MMTQLRCWQRASPRFERAREPDAGTVYRKFFTEMGKRSHAEHQKRYRERLKAKRDGVGVTPATFVTISDASSPADEIENLKARHAAEIERIVKVSSRSLRRPSRSSFRRLLKMQIVASRSCAQRTSL